MVIAFISIKGGVGKSTLAAHAYGYAKREGLNVWLVDTDAQGSSSAWVDGEKEDAQCYHITDPVEAAKAIKARRADSDLVIVDGGAGAYGWDSGCPMSGRHGGAGCQPEWHPRPFICVVDSTTRAAHLP